jgi:hypothetical protein
MLYPFQSKNSEIIKVANEIKGLRVIKVANEIKGERVIKDLSKNPFTPMF